MRLDFPQLVRSNKAKSAQAVSFAAQPQFFETRQFGCAGCDDDLAAYFVWNCVLTAELDHGRRPGNAQLRLLRSGFVVHAGVYDAAVVSALVACDAVFLLQQQKPEPRKSARNLQRDREADDASSDDDCVVAGFGHSGFGQVSHTSIARNGAVVNSSARSTDH